jgi:hypothetical protein
MSARNPRCQALPLADHQVSFLVDRVERLRWHYGPLYPRPFFFPLVGPSGTPLTRMGHPGDFSHEHHRSIWFAHADVLGLDFWSEGKPTRIRQKEWLCYVDGDLEAVLACRLGWFDAHEAELLEQELIAAVRPAADGATHVELQSALRPKGRSLTLGQSNFGLLAVRVAKNLSAYFGGGKIASSEGQEGEPAIFGQPARWVDYSGPVGDDAIEGITYYDHPANPDHPTRWHVREDGWMGAGLSRLRAIEIQRDSPLVCRYLLETHRGPVDARQADGTFAAFARLPPYELALRNQPHGRYTVRRAEG